MTTLRIANRIWNTATDQWDRWAGTDGRADVRLPTEQVQTDGLTDAELRASDVKVSLDGEEVALTRGDTNGNPLYVGWSGSQQVTVSGSVHVITQGNNSLSVDAAQDGTWDVSVNNLPTDYATAAKQLPDNHNVTVSNVPTEYPLPAAQVSTLTPQSDALTNAELRASAIDVDTGLNQPTTPSDTQPVSATSLPLPTGAATEAKQDTSNTSLSSIDGKLSDQSGTWGYDSGTAGSISVSAGRRVLQITAVAGASGATMTINGGDTVTIPALTSITIEPKGNLTSPSLVFTSTTGYFVEHVS